MDKLNLSLGDFLKILSPIIAAVIFIVGINTTVSLNTEATRRLQSDITEIKTITDKIQETNNTSNQLTQAQISELRIRIAVIESKLGIQKSMLDESH